MSIKRCHMGICESGSSIPSSDVNWASWYLKSLATWQLIQQLAQTNNKENKAWHYQSKWGESTDDWWIPLTKGQYYKMYFHVMISSWFPNKLLLECHWCQFNLNSCSVFEKLFIFFSNVSVNGHCGVTPLRLGSYGLSIEWISIGCIWSGYVSCSCYVALYWSGPSYCMGVLLSWKWKDCHGDSH